MGDFKHLPVHGFYDFDQTAWMKGARASGGPEKVGPTVELFPIK